MKRRNTDQRGIAAIEMALGMLLLVPLLLVLVETTKALSEYSQLQNAAMEGARMLARQNGDTTGVSEFVKSLFQNADSSSTLDGDTPTVSISPRDPNNNVTVQVQHEFTPFFTPQTNSQGSVSAFSLLGSDSLTLSASTTMALPAAN